MRSVKELKDAVEEHEERLEKNRLQRIKLEEELYKLRVLYSRAKAKEDAENGITATVLSWDNASVNLVDSGGEEFSFNDNTHRYRNKVGKRVKIATRFYKQCLACSRASKRVSYAEDSGLWNQYREEEEKRLEVKS